MTVDEVIRQAFLDKGLTLEEVEALEGKGDNFDPLAASFGKIQVTAEEAALIRRDLEIISRLPKEAVINLLNWYQRNARQQAVSN